MGLFARWRFLDGDALIEAAVGGGAHTAAIATSVGELGGTGYVRYLTRDGLYLFSTTATLAGTTRVPNCGPPH